MSRDFELYERSLVIFNSKNEAHGFFFHFLFLVEDNISIFPFQKTLLTLCQLKNGANLDVLLSVMSQR